MERTLKDVLRSSARESPPDFETWSRMRDAVVEALKRFGVEDESQSGTSGNFWVADEWQGSNYVPIVATSFLLRQECVEAVQAVIRGKNASYCSTLVVPFPAEFWGLQVLVTCDAVYVSAHDAESELDVESVLKGAGLEYLSL